VGTGEGGIMTALPNAATNAAPSGVNGEDMAKWLTVVGIGEDGYSGLGKHARRALLAAEVVVGAPRQLGLLPACVSATRQCWPTPFDVRVVLERKGAPTCVLASGDPMLYGVGATLSRHVPIEEMAVLPAPSSYSLAAARLGWALQDTTLLSVVARPAALINRHLHASQRLLILSQDGSSPAVISKLLRDAGFGASRVHVLEHLGGPNERILDGLAEDWSLEDCAALNIVAVECRSETAAGMPLTPGLPDETYQHDGQLTKRDVRALTLARLAPRPGELLWDVGAGCGSIGIEWMRAHPACRAIAIEADSERQQLIQANRDALGVPRLQLIQGRAPHALENLATPDAIFIGGGVTVPGVLERCWEALRPGGRLIANAVTLQSEMQLIGWREANGGELVRIDLSYAKPLGSFDTWRNVLPITLLQAQKP
jgi:precorrin-6Y C5,15-methyltransferase (decarboxylating)